MPVDNAGNELAAGDVVLLAGTVRRIESGDVVVVLGAAGTLAVRAKPGDLLDVSKVSTTDGLRNFAVPPSADALPTTAGQLTPKAYVDTQINNLALLATALFQPASAKLTALASVTTGADVLPYFTGASTAAGTTITAAARALLDDTSATAMRTTLGAAAASHSHDATDIMLSDTDWAGALAGSGIATVQDLANWIDANFPA